MNNFKILLNNRYTAATETINSNLVLQNDYLVYINRNGGGIVNAYNVRGYLNDSRNQQITNDFFAFLTGSTTQDQALNILTADKKLADTFNDYYQRVIISATQIANTAVIEQNLTGSNQIVAYEYLHPWSGFSLPKQLTGITQEIHGTINEAQARVYLEDFTTEQSYYVPLFLERGTNQLSRYHYDICDTFINKKNAGLFPNFSGITNSFFGSQSISNIVSNVPQIGHSFFNLLNIIPLLSSSAATATTADTRIHTLLNCFVDLNLETNENTGAEAPLPKVFFEFSGYTINEGGPLSVIVGLDAPSAGGIEQATIDLINPLTNIALSPQDYSASQTYPITLIWSTGEQFKTLSFSALTDFFLEDIESFNLQISNIINCDPGEIINTTVNITDTTILRTVSLGLVSTTPSFNFGSGTTSASVTEGNFVDLLVSLDGPAFGVESIWLNLVSTASTIGGTVGPSPNPAIIGTDFIISGVSMVFNFLEGETQKTFRFSAKTDSIIEQPESVLFEILNPQFCLINQAKKVVALTIEDSTGAYKYIHLNFGSVYSEFGDSQMSTLLRQINPQPGFFGTYSNIYTNQYAHNLIEYGTTINFKDYNASSPFDSDTYNAPLVKVKFTNTGTIQSIINGNILNTGQTIIMSLSGNNYIFTATTNSDKNISTNFYDYANYKIEIINNYSGKTFSKLYTPSPDPLSFKLRTTGNTLSTNNIINLGTWSLSGMTSNPTNTIGQYRLKSKYKNVNTGRPNIGSYSSPVYTCPPVGTFSDGISYSEFYAVDVENISVLGIIFLNFNLTSDYTNNSMTNYDSFEFVSGMTTTAGFYTCLGGTSPYTSFVGIEYINIPFRLEP